MNEWSVISALITKLEDNWADYKHTDCPLLAQGVGYPNRKGVYHGYPITIAKFPCLGVMPRVSDYEVIGSANREATEFEINIYFYAYAFHKDEKTEITLLMSKCIKEIISADRSLGGMVDFMAVRRCEYGEFVRRSMSGSEIIAVGGVATVTIQENRARS